MRFGVSIYVRRINVGWLDEERYRLAGALGHVTRRCSKMAVQLPLEHNLEGGT